MKTCRVCNATKDLHEFDKMRNATGEQVATHRCKACRREYMNQYNRKKPSKTGLSREDYLNSIRKPRLSPEQKQELGKQKWEAWYEEYYSEENIAKLKEEAREKGKQEREERLAAGVKTCGLCKEELPLSQFHTRTRKKKDGYSYKAPYPYCKTCRRVENRKHDNTPTGKARKKRSTALRDRRSRQATPKWLTAEQRKQIVDIYEHMRDCRAVTGEDYHVDHIVPLRGDNICGLHVPWNLQVLPAYINISKSNSFEE